MCSCEPGFVCSLCEQTIQDWRRFLYEQDGDSDELDSLWDLPPGPEHDAPYS